MKLCATCQKSLEDQTEICPRCQMKTGPYDLLDYSPWYRHHHRWTLFPPVPKTHWWGIELTQGPAGERGEHGSVASKGTGVVAIGPKQLDLGTGFYEFHCLLSVNSVPAREVEIGILRVLGDNNTLITPSPRRIKGVDFDTESREARIAIEFQIELSKEAICCEFRSNERGQEVGLGLAWIRLVPRFGWRWNRWDGKSFECEPKAVVRASSLGVTLKPHPDNDDPEFWGPYIYLPSGFYQLKSSISADASAKASWHVFSVGRELVLRQPIGLNSSLRNKPQIVTRNFYLDESYREVEFRIFVEQGQITVHWLQLTPPEGTIWERYYELGGKDSVLGLPISAEGRTDPSDIGRKGRYRRFERGTIYFDNDTYKAWEVWGAIGSHYEKNLGGTAGFGFPTGPVRPITSSQGTLGEVQHFEGHDNPGRAIFAYPSERNHVYAIRGATSSIYWKTAEGPAGPLGFPIKQGNFDWLKEGDGTSFQRSDFEGGYITCRSGEPADIHYYPKPYIEVEYPKQISLGKELVINVIGDLEGGPIRGAWCTVSFPDQVDARSIKFDAAENTFNNIHISKKGEPTSGNYIRNPNMVLQYPRIELGRWESDWPSPPANRFEVRLRPTRTGQFRIFARFTAQDAFDPNIIRGDPDPNWIEIARNEQNEADPDFLGIDPDRKLSIVRDHQDEAVYVYVVQISQPPSARYEEFDVFLCHNNDDKLEVKRIGELLKEQGILPWLDEWQLQPGIPWQRQLEKQIEQVKSAAVFVGGDGIGPWQQEELEALIKEFTKRECPVIPVLLPNATNEPKLPLFLSNRAWVDFRKQDPDPIERLIWGITGKRGSAR